MDAAKAMPAAPASVAAPAAVAKDDDDDDAPQLHHDDGEDDDTDSDADAMDKAIAAVCIKYGWEPRRVEGMPMSLLHELLAADKSATAAPAPAEKPKVPCPKCKKPNKAKAKFCGKCGSPMMAEKTSASPPQVTG